VNAKQVGLGIVFVAFAALNVHVVVRYGYLGFLELATANAATTAVLVDLTIALGLITVWLWRDARARGVTAVPYVMLTIFFGSIGPLLYLISRLGQPTRHSATSAGARRP
jgi:hypothetical protein